MLLLAIDTSGKQGSIALARAGEPTAEAGDFEVVEVAPLVGGTFSAQLIPQIAELLSSNGFMKTAIGAFAVAAGRDRSPVCASGWRRLRLWLRF